MDLSSVGKSLYQLNSTFHNNNISPQFKMPPPASTMTSPLESSLSQTGYINKVLLSKQGKMKKQSQNLKLYETFDKSRMNLTSLNNFVKDSDHHQALNDSKLPEIQTGIKSKELLSRANSDEQQGISSLSSVETQKVRIVDQARLNLKTDTEIYMSPRLPVQRIQLSTRNYMEPEVKE